jgi:uncharacterized protein
MVSKTTRSSADRVSTPGGATLTDVTSIDLRRLRLRRGEVRQEAVELELEPFELAGQRYEPIPAVVPADVEIGDASGPLVFRLRFRSGLSGPCMRCLGHAELPLDVSAREVHELDAPDQGTTEELRSDYVVDGRLDVSAWARDAIALELPEQILCRAECAGLCPVCGKDLNVEPHEHVERDVDPRWAVLEQLRDEL